MRAAAMMFGVMLAACGGGSDYEANGDVLVALGSAVCDRAIECRILVESDRDRCESESLRGACDDIDCTADFEGDVDDVEACIDAFADFSCTSLGDELIPSRCRTL